MNDEQQAVARACLAGSEGNTMVFPDVIRSLMQAGFEGYAIDFRRSTATYSLPNGDSLKLRTHVVANPVAPAFDAAAVRAAIKEAQQQVPGYTYRGFCEKAAAAGCASYIVSFSGRRVLYIGRTAETHTEHFPDRP
jgi:uncharacterized protein YbcV (DUF1398 family)